nr:hypothetical protein [Histophilus somni]
MKSEYGVAIGHGTVVGTGAKNSIAISATKDNDKGSLQNAEWAISIGNKNNVSGGNDIVALGSNIEVTSKSQSAVVLGKGANVQANATGAVAIGESATVEENAGDSIALGKNSKAKEKQIAPTGITQTTGQGQVKITWRECRSF